MSLRIVVYGLSIWWSFTAGFCFSQEDKHVPDALDAASKTWLSSVDLYSRFSCKIEISSQSGEGRRQTFVANGLGKLAFDSDAFRISMNWTPVAVDGENSVLPYKNFDFVSRKGIDVANYPRCIALNHDPAIVPNLEDRVPYGALLNRTTNAGSLIQRRSPISEIPNPLVFAGGWNEGVVFGGLVYHPKSARLRRKLFENHGFGEKDGITILLDRISEELLEIKMTKQSKQRYSERRIQFEVVAGLPVKTLETFESRKSDGEPILLRKAESIGAINCNQFVVPERLLINEEYVDIKKRYEFSFVPRSIRETQRTDFRINIGKTRKGLEVDADGFFNIKDLGNEEIQMIKKEL